MSAIEGGEVSVTETFRIMFVIEGQDMSKCMDMIARYIIRTAGEPSFDQFRWLHNIWKQERIQGNKDIDHPLKAVVEAWLTEQIPKVQPKRRKDTGILHHSLRDSSPSPRLNMGDSLKLDLSLYRLTHNYYELQPIYLSTLAGEPLDKTREHAAFICGRGQRIGLSLNDTL